MEIKEEIKKDFNVPNSVFTYYDFKNKKLENYIYENNFSSIFENIFKLYENNINELISNKYLLEKYSQFSECLFKYIINNPRKFLRDEKNINSSFYNLITYLNNDNVNNYIEILLKNILLNFDIEKNLINKLLEKINYKVNDKILLIFYCRGDVDYLENINLEVNDFLLQKALLYGRNDVIQLLDEKGLLNKHSNPFGLNLAEYRDSVIDIWGGYSWGNDECEKPIIGSKNFKECFVILKKYFELKDEYYDIWLNLCSKDKYGYCSTYDEINSLFLPENKLWNKEILNNLINRFGKKTIWKYIIKSCDENFLDIII